MKRVEKKKRWSRKRNNNSTNRNVLLPLHTHHTRTHTRSRFLCKTPMTHKRLIHRIVLCRRTRTRRTRREVPHRRRRRRWRWRWHPFSIITPISLIVFPHLKRHKQPPWQRRRRRCHAVMRWQRPRLRRYHFWHDCRRCRRGRWRCCTRLPTRLGFQTISRIRIASTPTTRRSRRRTRRTRRTRP